ncbi:MAG: MFS transporter, partial [Candidatus Latescibacteria bacterium]|nr:MFS transporter [Candidatus Latescibacterota bacterium]
MSGKPFGDNNNQKKQDIAVSLNINLFLMFGVTLMAVMGVSSIAPVFPRIMKELHLSKMEVGMLISFFTVPGVIFSLFFGILADRLGRKTVLIPSLILFGIAGGTCAFVRDFHILLLLRFFQGVGAAALGTLSPTILSDLYSGKNRTVVMGYNASVLNVGTASYPAIGGAVAAFGWYYPFLLPLTAIPLGIAILLFLENPEPKDHRTISEYMHGTLKSIMKKQVIGIFIVGAISFFVLYGSYLMFFPIVLDTSFDSSPFVIGMIMSLTSITAALTASQIKHLVKRYDEKILLRAGFILYALAMVIVPFLGSIWQFVFPTMLYGVGIGINIPCITSILASLAPFEHRAAFLSINSMMLRVGQTMGPLLMGLIAGIGGTTGVFFAG